MKRTRLTRAALAPALLLSALSLSTLPALGCRGPQAVEPPPPELTLPEAFGAPRADGPAHDRDTLEDAWCHDFGEPALADFVQRAVSRNLDYRLAATRVREADALLGLSRSQRMPRVAAEAGVGRGNALVPGPTGPTLDTRSNFNAGVTAAWEVDIWGRAGAQVRATLTERDAARLDLRALEMAIAARAAEATFQIARAREERTLLAEQLDTAVTFLGLLDDRFRLGQATALDVLQQRQNVEELRSREPRLALEEQLALQALARLAGEAGEAVDAPRPPRLPRVDATTVDALPADLLERRPDVAAARMRAVAADLRVDAALRERLPRLRLSANLGLQATSLTELFDYLFWSVGAALTQSVFEGGRIRAEVERQRALAERALLAYTQVLLDAIHEVEDAMARAAAQDAALQDIGTQLDLARIALDAARERFRGGELDFLRVLTAQQAVQRLEVAMLDARRGLLTQQIQLCRAAGGVPTPTTDAVHGDEE